MGEIEKFTNLEEMYEKTETINIPRVEIYRNAEPHEEGTIIDTQDLKYILLMDYDEFQKEYKLDGKSE